MNKVLYEWLKNEWKISNHVKYQKYFEEWVKNLTYNHYGLSDNLFYQYVIHNNYVENRYWEKRMALHFENMKFIRKGGEYGMDATPTIDKMLSVMEMEFKDLLLENKDGYFEIYINYYKKIKEKD